MRILTSLWWCQGFLTTETAQALEFFEQATDCFKKALNEASCSKKNCFSIKRHSERMCLNTALTAAGTKQ